MTIRHGVSLATRLAKQLPGGAPFLRHLQTGTPYASVVVGVPKETHSGEAVRVASLPRSTRVYACAPPRSAVLRL